MSDKPMMSGGEVTMRGGRAMVTVESGGGGLTEVEGQPPPPPRPPEPDQPVPPVIKTFSEMAIRALTAANTSSSSSRSAEQGA
ncbi:hypothetical protein AMC83_PA00039 (plasmid) [Rhizobium phaseoli]|uniref:hypothetical protein n=1 Tax=Rhizobium phaseoli TaxID=396 RepID=UPI0007F11FDF|nr:hypothetical protein [Rhizobium phaseoli]ANL74266.1 hypothetical protein AMC83_PA00039 [Rhizobium phaseoli]